MSLQKAELVPVASLQKFGSQDDATQVFVLCDRCSIQRTQEQMLMAMNSTSSVPMASLNSLEVPQPDVTPACKAMIGCCQARTVWMSVKVGILQRLARLHTSSKSSDSSANSLEVFTVSFTLGLCIYQESYKQLLMDNKDPLQACRSYIECRGYIDCITSIVCYLQAYVTL